CQALLQGTQIAAAQRQIMREVPQAGTCSAAIAVAGDDVFRLRDDRVLQFCEFGAQLGECPDVEGSRVEGSWRHGSLRLRNDSLQSGPSVLPPRVSALGVSAASGDVAGARK